MKTSVGLCSSGNAPYLMAARIGKEMGDVIVPKYPSSTIQEKVLNKWYGGDAGKIFLDPVLGELTDKLGFHGNYQEFVKANLRDGEKVKKELKEHLSGKFDAISLSDGSKKTFSAPDFYLSTGPVAYVPYPEKSFYIFPGYNSKFIERLPNSESIEGAEEFIKIAYAEERAYWRAYIPMINTFSYMEGIALEPNEVQTPPLQDRLINTEAISKPFVFTTLSGTDSELNSVILEAAEKLDYQIFKPIGDSGPGIEKPPSIIFNANCKAQIARSGWGTLWNGQVAGVPTLVPSYKKNDDPEIYHNNFTVEKFNLGIVFRPGEISVKMIEEAVAKKDAMLKLNSKIERDLGTIEGFKFVARDIENLVR